MIKEKDFKKVLFSTTTNTTGRFSKSVYFGCKSYTKVNYYQDKGYTVYIMYTRHPLTFSCG